MKIVCSLCQHEITLDEARVPQGAFRVKCPKCSTANVVQKDAPSPAATGAPEIAPAVEAFVKRELANLKSELLAASGSVSSGSTAMRNDSEETPQMTGEKTALLCIEDSSVSAAVAASLKSMGYSVEIVKSAADASQKLDAHVHELIGVDQVLSDDKEGSKKIIARVNGLKPSERRQTFVFLLSPSLKSMDGNAAFLNGVNLVVNKNDIRNIDHLIREGQNQFKQMYQLYNRLLAEKQQSTS